MGLRDLDENGQLEDGNTPPTFNAPQERLTEKLMRVQIQWCKPPEVLLSSSWHVCFGENSEELHAQIKRTQAEQEAIYQTSHQIPPNPQEPLVSEIDYDDALTPVIPTDSLGAETEEHETIDYNEEFAEVEHNYVTGIFGENNIMHQEFIEFLSYVMIAADNHIFISAASGTNAAVIRGALKAEKPDLLTVILPQSLKIQPAESQELLTKVANIIEMPQNDHLPLIEACRLCNREILSHVQQVICFAFRDSSLLIETCQEAENLGKSVYLFYLDGPQI